MDELREKIDSLQAMVQALQGVQQRVLVRRGSEFGAAAGHRRKAPFPAPTSCSSLLLPSEGWTAQPHPSRTAHPPQAANDALQEEKHQLKAQVGPADY